MSGIALAVFIKQHLRIAHGNNTICYIGSKTNTAMSKEVYPSKKIKRESTTEMPQWKNSSSDLHITDAKNRTLTKTPRQRRLQQLLVYASRKGIYFITGSGPAIGLGPGAGVRFGVEVGEGAGARSIMCIIDGLVALPPRGVPPPREPALPPRPPRSLAEAV